MGAMARNAVAANGGLGVQGPGTIPAMRGPQGFTTGTNGEVKNGVLSFTDSTGKRLTMKVQPGSGTGTWLAFNIDGKDGNDKIVNVLPNGNVVLLPLDPAVKAQMQRSATQQ